MKNFIFISPNFPTNYWQFCRELKNDGMNVLGIGDQPYDELKPELKDSLNEYYKVGSLENYDEVYRAVAFLTFKHGRIDWLESNNEYWLERDAALRTDFHITSGFQTSDMPRIKYKSKMKECYQKAGIATARYHMVDDLAGCKKFVEEVGYPVVVKPDNGVGASDTHKLASDAELEAFLAYKAKEHPDVSYIMEEFVHAEVNSYDAIIDGSGNPIFEAGNVSPMSIMDIVNNDDNSIYYIIKDLPEDKDLESTTKEILVSEAPCAQAITLIPLRPSVPKSLPAIPGVCFIFSPTIATVARFLSARIGEISPISISFANSSFSTSQARSASALRTPIEVLFSDEACETRNTLIPFFANALKMR